MQSGGTDDIIRLEPTTNGLTGDLGHHLAHRNTK